MPDRQSRIETIIRKNITEIISYKIKDPHLGFFTITDVKVSKDFSYATVLVSFLREEDEKEGMKTLLKAKGFIRTELSRTLDTRRCPEIRFVLDDGYKKEERITELLNQDKKKENK